MEFVTKAIIFECDKSGSQSGSPFEVQFNPNKITIDEDTGHFARKKSKQPAKKNAAAIQETPSAMQSAPFDESRSITFSTDLFFNTCKSASDYSDVRPLIHKFDKFLNKSVEKSNELKRLCFSWGSIQIFGLLTSMRVSYTMFSGDGYPVRAEASISICGDYVKYTQSPVPKAEQTRINVSEPQNFAAALAAYGTISALKTAAQSSGVVNLRVLK